MLTAPNLSSTPMERWSAKGEMARPEAGASRAGGHPGLQGHCARGTEWGLQGRAWGGA